MFHNTVYMFGDPNQCEPVEAGVKFKIHYGYLTSKTIQEMCPKREALQYIQGSSGYDQETHEMLARFLKTRKISTYFTPFNKYYKNICYSNSTGIKVNTECCENKKNQSVNFKYNGKRESYNVCVGMPVIATRNIKDKETFNTMEFAIQDIQIKDMWFDDIIDHHNNIPNVPGYYKVLK